MTRPPLDLAGAHPADPASRRRQGIIDAGVAALYAIVFVGYPLAVLAVQHGLAILPWVARTPESFSWSIDLASRATAGLVVISAVALALRRIQPRTSFLIICGVGAVQLGLGEPIALWNVAMLVSLFSAAAHTSRAFGRLALAIAAAAYLGIWVQATGLLYALPKLSSVLELLATGRGAAFVAIFGLLVLIWSLGDQVRATRERYEFVQERALQLERERDANARLAALAERQRIARELHDVVAHGLSVVIVQADGALYAAAEHPDAPLQALAAISATGRESLTEMRRLLGVLRDGSAAAELAPQPGISSIPELVEQFLGAGLAIEMVTDGPARPLAPTVGLAGYRVVQESFTNVLKYAGHAAVRLRLAYGPASLSIEVANAPGDRPPSPPATPGLGLTGMRERIALLGGRLSAGPTTSGGFLVRAEIPYGHAQPFDGPAGAPTRSPATTWSA